MDFAPRNNETQKLNNVKKPSYEQLTTRRTNIPNRSTRRKRKKKHSFIKKLAMLFLVLVLVVAGAAGYILQGFGTTDDNGSDVYVKIGKGMIARDIGKMLEDRGIITSGIRFQVIARIKGSADKFQAGVYELRYGLSEEEAIDMLTSKDKATALHIMIPEGLGVKEIAKRLEKMGVVRAQDFMEAAKYYAPYSYIQPPANVHYAIEGFLFPATYDFGLDTDARAILARMAKEMDTRLTMDIRRRAAAKNLSVYQLVTLASLVEKEAMFKEDQPIIAQVFLKRLSMNMPLQTDTTIQYLLDAPKEDVSIADTQIDSPYNTYEHKGLPPGPIASPGMDAIEAVLNPANTDYLYFVADRQGHNHYSYTYEEHMENVNQYR